MPRSHAVSFAFGVVVGFFIAAARWDPPFPKTRPPSHLNLLPSVGVSHNPEIGKRVLVAKGDMPHVTQIAIATLKPGQVASTNSHKDMVELFLFLDGQGELQLSDTNHSVGQGTFATIYPPTPHTIYNSHHSDMRLLTVASA